MLFSPLTDQLIQALRCLPGVGPKSAQRMAFHLLQKQERQAGFKLAETLKQALAEIGQCKQCRTLSETEICSLCNNNNRDASLLCIVETPADLMAIEQTNIYRGRYFVLMGHLSPIDGIGPDEIGIPILTTQLQENTIKEIILATNSTVEGEATAYYITQLANKFQLKTSRIAHGVPLGGELEYIDGGTLAHAFASRVITPEPS